jgi:SAM-dependent methyltransferase
MAMRNWLAVLKAIARFPGSHVEAMDRIARVQNVLEHTEAKLHASIEGEAARVSDQVHREITRLSDQLNLALRDLTLLTRRQLEFQRETRLLLDQMAKPADPEWNLPFPPSEIPPKEIVFPGSSVCRQDAMATAAYPYWMHKIGFAPIWHRKRWEFMYICQVLYERGFLAPGIKGLGFGVGEEPLPAFFASQGCRLTLTDMPPEAAADAGWVETEQYAVSRETLRRPFVCPDDVFDANVSFRFCDMNAIPPDLKEFDFCWSACALEHLGSIESGLAFIESSVDTLRPGGIAVHTTEFNLSSNDDTVAEGSTVLFRRRDLEGLAERLNKNGHVMALVDFDPGQGVMDRYIDVPPYRDEPHLKLALSGYACTSLGLFVRRAD